MWPVKRNQQEMMSRMCAAWTEDLQDHEPSRKIVAGKRNKEEATALHALISSWQGEQGRGRPRGVATPGRPR